VRYEHASPSAVHPLLARNCSANLGLDHWASNTSCGSRHKDVKIKFPLEEKLPYLGTEESFECNNTVAGLLKARIVKPAAVARQWLSSRHDIAATDMRATIEKLLEAVFSMRSVPRL
jgi:hypothetical protein